MTRKLRLVREDGSPASIEDLDLSERVIVDIGGTKMLLIDAIRREGPVDPAPDIGGDLTLRLADVRSGR